MSQTIHYAQVDDFVGGSGPTTGAQQHLQWCGLACGGHPPPSSSPRVPASSTSENQPPGLAPHLLHVSLSRHRVVNPIDGEDDRRQRRGEITRNLNTLEE